MTRTDTIPNYLERDAPKLYRWALEDCGDTGHLHVTGYEKHLRASHTIPNEPVFRIFGDDFTYQLYDALSRAELHARLICLPHQVAIDRMMQVQKLRLGSDEKAEHDTIQHRVYDTQACLRTITNASVDLADQLVKGAQQVEWMRMMVSGEQLPPDDKHRSEFFILRRRLEDGRSERSSMLKACDAMQLVESNVQMLHEQARATRFSDAYEPHLARIHECWIYTGTRLYPSVSQELAEVRNAMDVMRAHYDNLALRIRQNAHPEPANYAKPGTRIHGYHTQSVEETDDILRKQGEGSNVVKLSFAKSGMPKGRGG